MLPDTTSIRPRLDRALDGLAVAFRGMTARPDEVQCECHWGSPEELALLKAPGVPLTPDLLRRTWDVPDWDDYGAVLRRILPQFAQALVRGEVEPMFGMYEVGRSFARGNWQRWPAQQSAAVREFLHAWWAQNLLDPAPAVPAHELLSLCAEAAGTAVPWLTVWESVDDEVSDRHLREAAAAWEYGLLGDQLPWDAWDDEDESGLRGELSTWLVRHAPTRLRTRDGCGTLLHRIRLIGLSGPDRWEDPHWPGHRY
ncbi:hypothetical protein ACF058_04270 [Streptomyces sp. NPDC015501]|uniref:hypothetical protein n=1 Tax=unclassified Streptomyces TaxID=2593676 RepID=UPI0011A337D1|nr:hypothetical protein A3L22_04230 [Streptomyces griseus subsp. griseus]WSS59305.1 hypothetical protein OG543_07215 [Streptomyces sp. NBC_01178]